MDELIGVKRLAEIKINRALYTEISNIKKAGIALNEDYTKVENDNEGLSAASRYETQQDEIKELFDAYIELLEKDLDDLCEYANSITKADRNSMFYIGCGE